MGALKLRSLLVEREFVTEVIESVQSVFAEGFNMHVEYMHHRIGNGQVEVGDVSAAVAMVQRQTEGCMTVSLRNKILNEILEKVYALKFSGPTQQGREAVAEIANMIYGKLKVRLNDRGYDLQMSIPSMTDEPDHYSNFNSNQGTALHAVFKYDSHVFDVMVAIQVLD